MTIAADDPLSSGPYTGNGVTTVFDYDFTIFAETELTVIKQTVSTLAEEVLVLDTDYTVTPADSVFPNPGTITLLVAPTSGEKIVIQPNITPSQDRPYSTQGSLRLTEIEDAQDKLTMLVRQLLERAERSVTISAFSDVSDLDQLRADIETVAALLELDDIAIKSEDNVFTGTNTVNTGNLIQQVFRARAADDTSDIDFREAGGGLSWKWAIRAQARNTGAFSLRHNDTAILTLASSGNLTLSGSSGAFISGVGGVISNSEVQARTDSNPSYGFRKAAGTIGALLYLNRALGAVPDRAGKLAVNYYDDDGSDARVVAVIEDNITKGGTLGQSTSIVTREHGDVRYAQPFQTVRNAQAVFTGDANTLFTVNDSQLYFCNTSATNTPAAVNGSLLVQSHPSNGNFCTQIFTEAVSVSPRQWYRSRASGTWSAWQLVATPSLPVGWTDLAEQTLSGADDTFTGIPAAVREVSIQFEQMSLSGTGNVLLRVGGAGSGLQTTGYGNLRTVNATTTGIFTSADAGGLFIPIGNAAFTVEGTITLRRYRQSNRWHVGSGQLMRGTDGNLSYTGHVDMSEELDRIGLVTTAGTFDSGDANVAYRY